MPWRMLSRELKLALRWSSRCLSRWSLRDRHFLGRRFSRKGKVVGRFDSFLDRGVLGYGIYAVLEMPGVLHYEPVVHQRQRLQRSR